MSAKSLEKSGEPSVRTSRLLCHLLSPFNEPVESFSWLEWMRNSRFDKGCRVLYY